MLLAIEEGAFVISCTALQYHLKSQQFIDKSFKKLN